ncbi:MAG: 16S rRNA G1207 methylase RsmC [Bacteriovoracaceae bacterium]|jgi:23S rRNA (guanine1835-N2)-methyltransferase
MKNELPTIFISPITGNEMQISRYPVRKWETLQAWDAADELLLSEIPEELINCNILIINDSFGALTRSLIDSSPTVYSDSYSSFKGIEENCQGLSRVTFFKDLNEIDGKFDLVLLKVPKSLTHLEDTLVHLTKLMNPGAQFLAGIMIKHSSSAIFDLISKYLGETSTSLAKKKARVIKAKFEKALVDKEISNIIDIPEYSIELKNLSNVFSNKKLDLGTRFFIDYIPEKFEGKILDLGCANGILGIMAKKSSPNAEIIFTDDSFMAVESARFNYSKIIGDDKAVFKWMNCYEDKDLPKVDLVLCNPPFHQQNTITKDIAYQMFRDAYQGLNSGGKILVVGNLHLGYQVQLKKIFGNFSTKGKNKKFIVLESIKK